MRPLCLTVQAFGAYAESQVFDFSKLNGRSFFLIHGPTGSGKTTILDAICFSLYGDCSGSIRESKSMRSDYAMAEVMTYTEFSFALGEETYSIRRVPEQLRPKKRGDGMTAMLSEAELFKLTGDDKKLLSSGWLKVTEKVEELLGFKSNQFRQVVLLPQGEFRRLLTANSAERQEIMQALFKTEFYRQIEENLKVKAQTIKKDYEELNKETQWVLREAEAEDKDALTIRLSENKEELKLLTEELKLAATALSFAQQKYTEGKSEQQKIAEYQEALTHLTEIEAKTEIVAQKRLELERAKQAAAIIDMENMVKQLTEEVRAASEIREREEIALLNAKSAKSKAFEILEAELLKEPLREKASEEVLRLQETAGRLSALDEANGALLEHKKALQQREKEHAESLTKLEKLEADLKKQTEEHQQLLELAMREESYQAKFTELTQKVIRLEEYKEAYTKWEKAKVTLEEAKNASEALNARFLGAKAAFAALNEAWLSGQAAVMAAELHKDMPCPVCGSLDHPQLAVPVGDLPSEEEVKAQQHNVEILEKEREERLKSVSLLKTAQDTLYNRTEDLKLELKDVAEKDLSELEEAAKVIKGELDKAVKAKKLVECAKENIEKLTKAQTELTHLRDASIAKMQQAAASYQAALAVAEERRSAILAEYLDSSALAKAYENAKLVQQRLKLGLEEAKTKADGAERQLIKCQASLENAEKNLGKLNLQYGEKQNLYNERLEEAGFSDEADYQKAKKTPMYIEKLAERILIFEQDFIKAKERCRLADEAAKGLIAPDLLKLEEEVVKARTAYDDLLAKDTRLKTEAERITLWLKKLAGLFEKKAQVESQYAVLGRLSEVANGGNEFKLTFQRFVLGALLEDVAAAANQRLLIMSRGRYELQRTMDRARKNAAGGLDLEVFDSHTGTARGIGTLSGGEMFLASLSLALGLSDAVQSYAGGIKLDTILVDEGFGTLDPETLDIAIKALIDLQKGGRLVGIISHVPELKERIDARLEVILTDKGSRAEFKVG